VDVFLHHGLFLGDLGQFSNTVSVNISSPSRAWLGEQRSFAAFLLKSFTLELPLNLNQESVPALLRYDH